MDVYICVMGKIILKGLVYTAAVILLCMLIAYVTGYGYLIRGVTFTYLKGYKSANIYDGNDFDTRTIERGSAISNLPRSVKYNQIALSAELLEMLDRTKTTSFLVLKNDSIVWEYYYRGHTDSTRSNAFSMAKSITTILVQKAIEEKIISGWDTKVKQYLPWLEGPFADKLTMKHLATMTAGLDWSESYYNPFGITARAYYSHDIESAMHRVQVVSEPGMEYQYQSGATQLLGLCLKKALKKPIADYASQKLWKPLGMEMGATWHTDDESGMELTYCCVNAITRDFARIGQMLLHGGKSENGRIIDSAFISNATKPVKADWYGQSFWLGESHHTHYYQMQGTMGQFIIVVPEANVVIVRTGHIYLHSKNGLPECSRTYTDETLNRWFKAETNAIIINKK